MTQTTFTDAVVSHLEDNLELSEAELQQMVQIDLENMINTYASKKIPAVLTLLHLQALVDVSIKELAEYFGSIVTNPESVAKEVKDLYGMTEEETKPIDEEIARLSKGI